MFNKGQRSKVKGERSKVKGQRFRFSFHLSPFSFQLSLLLASLLLCFSSLRAETIDHIAAIVDGEVITASDVDTALAHHQKDIREGPSHQVTADNLRREVIDKLVDDLLLKHSIDKAKINVDDDDLARAIANVLRQNRLTPEQLKADLAAKGISYDDYKHQLADQIRVYKFMNQIIGQQIKITDRDLRDFYEHNKSQFGGEASNFEAVKEKISDILYEERMREALNNYLAVQRKKAYIDIK
jgi:peptidyl-prolyl cis-trans isomerase SurA